jgi:aldehyde dehydrogenase (NAD(P)+)
MDHTELDQSIQELQHHKNEWARLPIPQKIDLLLQTRQRLAEYSQEWVTAAVRGKHMLPDSPEEGEEWTGGPWTLAHGINGYLDTLNALVNGHVLKPKRIHTRANGQVAARIFPNNIFDTLLLNGITAEVWMQPVSPKPIWMKKWQPFTGKAKRRKEKSPWCWGRATWPASRRGMCSTGCMPWGKW